MKTFVNGHEKWMLYKATGDRQLREELILQYAPLVKYVSGRMAIGLPAVLESEDILSHATIGLIDAVERFDPTRGLKFETYAIPRIRGSILDAVRRLGMTPRGAKRKLREIDNAAAILEEKLGRMPTDEEVASHLGISIEEYGRVLLESGFALVQLDSMPGTSEDDDFPSLSEVLEDTSAPNPLAEAMRHELREALIGALKELPERDRLVITLYYYEELTLKEISHVLEVSESRVCQLHTRALMKLRRSLLKAGMSASAPVS